MPSTPTPPAERFSAILHALAWAVAQRSGAGLSFQLIALITTRIDAIKHRFARLAARIQAGIYKPRRVTVRRPGVSRPWPTDPLPTEFGWLLKLVPYAPAAANSQLYLLFQDPEMQALMAAAPDAMRRPLRSLCHMLAIVPPPILARPKRPRPAPAPAQEPSSPSPLVGEGRGEGSRPAKAPDRAAKTPVRNKRKRPKKPARKTG